jgi:glycosyltransferase involved in cell wall biosynthesis
MKVLYITHFLEHPAAGGNQLKVENSIKALSQICDLYVCNVTSNRLIERLNEQALAFFTTLCAQVITLPSIEPEGYEGKPSGTNPRGAQFWKSQEHYHHPSKREDARFIVDYVHNHGISILWFDAATSGLYPLMKAILLQNPAVQIVCDTDSIWSRYILRGTSYAKTASQKLAIQKQGLRKKKEEQEWMQYSTVVTAVSSVDAVYYQRLARHPEQVHLFPNVIDITTYQHVLPPNDQFKKPCLYLAGTFWPQSPMEDAARWIIQEILPLVRQWIPTIHFYIIGNNSNNTLSDIDDPHITITGKVTSVLPYLYHADVVLVPLRFESGTRFKILEAGACGIPVVSTTLGAEGLPVTHKHNILLADTPESFADSILRVIEDRDFSLKLAENLRDFVKEHYTVDTLVPQGQSILDYLAAQSGNTSPSSPSYGTMTTPVERHRWPFQHMLKRPIKKAIFWGIKLINIFLYHLGFKIVSHSPKQGGYISAKETIEAAAQKHQRVSEYLEELWGEHGLAQEVIDQFELFGALHRNTKQICEIGTGTGWFAEKILKDYDISPSSYESYELNKEWATWLSQTLRIRSHPTDGISLRYTPSDSIDLVHANGVFVYTPFLTTYQYFLEIFRVTKKDGYAVFDIFSEDCFDEEIFNAWLVSGDMYPSMLSKEFIQTLFISNGFSFIGKFYRKLGQGISVYLIFKKVQTSGVEKNE